MIVELSEAAPVERPPFETDEATEGIDDEVGIVEEAVEDGNRSPDSIIYEREKNVDSIRQWDYLKELHILKISRTFRHTF